MSLLSSFLKKQLIPHLESTFLEHTPELQKMLIDEATELAAQIMHWVSDKIHHKNIEGK